MDLERPAEEDGERLLATETDHEQLPRQIVTLAFLEKQIPAVLISEQLARSLSAETGASVVLVQLAKEDGAGRIDGEAHPELFLNGEFHWPADLVNHDTKFHSLTLGVRNDPPTPRGIASLVSQLRPRFRYVLIGAQIDDPGAPWLSELLGRSNLAYVFLKPAAEDENRLDLLLRDTRARPGDGGVQVKPVAYLAEGEQVNGIDLLAQRAAIPVHAFVRGRPAGDGVAEGGQQAAPVRSFRADLRRLAREIGGRLVGLALSSGAAKGFAHVGVLQVLEEKGIEVDVVAGASMGAYVGALWAHGCDGGELERLSRELEGRWAFWSLIDPVFPPRRGFLRGFAVKNRLMRTVGHARFGDLKRPLRIVATNLATL